MTAVARATDAALASVISLSHVDERALVAEAQAQQP